MTHYDSHDDLQPVIEQLRAHRPEATPLELDAVKQRVRGRAAGVGRARSANPMKSRLAILATIVFGMMLSTAGAGLAVSGFAGNDDASVAQYGSDKGGGNGGAVLPETDEGGGDDVAGETDDVQPTRQAEAGVQAGDSGDSGDSELPFTGFAAIPILVGGVALLSVGTVLRRRARDDA